MRDYDRGGDSDQTNVWGLGSPSFDAGELVLGNASLRAGDTI